MGFNSYRTALSNIAQAEAGGEDTTSQINHLAAIAKIPVDTIRVEIAEIVEDL